MSDLSDYAGATKGVDSELQDFLLAEKQKAQFHAQVWWGHFGHKLSIFLALSSIIIFFSCFYRYMNLMIFAGTSAWINREQNWIHAQRHALPIVLNDL